MNEQVFREYAETKIAIKELTEKAKVLEAQVTEEMQKNELEKAKTNIGTFFFTSRKKWTYSDKVKEVELSVKEMKKQEEKDGTAKFEETKSLSFRA